MNKKSEGEKYVDYHDEIFEWVKKPWSASLGAFLKMKYRT